jgi:hypothetical protein
MVLPLFACVIAKYMPLIFRGLKPPRNERLEPIGVSKVYLAMAIPGR